MRQDWIYFQFQWEHYFHAEARQDGRRCLSPSNRGINQEGGSLPVRAGRTQTGGKFKNNILTQN